MCWIMLHFMLAPVLTRIASGVIVPKFCSLNHVIRAKKRPNTINRDTTHRDGSRLAWEGVCSGYRCYLFDFL